MRKIWIYMVMAVLGCLVTGCDKSDEPKPIDEDKTDHVSQTDFEEYAFGHIWSIASLDDMVWVTGLGTELPYLEYGISGGAVLEPFILKEDGDATYFRVMYYPPDKPWMPRAQLECEYRYDPNTGILHFGKEEYFVESLTDENMTIRLMNLSLYGPDLTEEEMNGSYLRIKLRHATAEEAAEYWEYPVPA